MSKISCDIIQDMLPLYYDEVCSADSRKMIEEHLQECEKCSNIFQKLKTECVVDTKENAESIQSSVMGKMAHSWKLWGDRIFEKCGIGRDEGGDGGKTLEIRGKRRLSARDGDANYQQS